MTRILITIYTVTLWTAVLTQIAPPMPTQGPPTVAPQLMTAAPQLPTAAPNSPNTYDPNCVDKIDSCWNMPESNCRDPYVEWAKDNCPNRCGYCKGPTTPAPPCQNTIPNCEAYDKSVCTSPDYQHWANENCRYWCRLCPLAELQRLDSMTTTIPPAKCVDKVDCRQYGTSSCGNEYKAWAEDNCPNYCGFCVGIPTPPPECKDRIPNCNAYDRDTCTNPSYSLWVEDNCRKYCGICVGGTTNTISYKQPTNAPSGKRSPRLRRQFHGSHHGASFDCFDNPDPACHTKTSSGPDASTMPSTTSSVLTGEFPGSEFKPRPKPDADWDSKPPSTIVQVTPTVIGDVPTTTTTTTTTTVKSPPTPSTTVTTWGPHGPPTTKEPCVDKEKNCLSYGKAICTNPTYLPFARSNCRAFCLFCIPDVECVDKIDNCADYDGGNLCTSDSYFQWAEKNCMAYCRFPPCDGTLTTRSPTRAP